MWQNIMYRHVHHHGHDFSSSYRDWFNTAATTRLLKSPAGPQGLHKPRSYFERGTPCPDFSLTTKPTRQTRTCDSFRAIQFLNRSAGSGKAGAGTPEEPGVTSFLQQCTAVTTSAGQALGGAGHPSCTYPMCPSEESLHLASPELWNSHGKKKTEPMRGGFRHISLLAFKAHFLAKGVLEDCNESPVI